MVACYLDYNLQMSEKYESVNPIPMSVAETINKIQALLQQEESKGAITTERDDIKVIISKLEAGECTPKEALDATEALFKSRQDYH